MDSIGDDELEDNVVTLREAISFAIDFYEPVAGETDEISGCPNDDDNPGAAIADDIFFNAGLFPSATPTTIAVVAAYPALSTGEDEINATSRGVILDGQTSEYTCLTLSGNSNRLQGLQIRRCDIGIDISGSTNVIFGASPRTTVRENGTGIRITGDGNSVFDSAIGTDVTGTIDMGNTDDGVHVEAGTGNRIAASIISGNGGDGVEITGTATGTALDLDRIGLSFSGVVLGNDGNGVFVNGTSNNCIGGQFVSSVCSVVPTRENAISGNASDGVEIVGGSGNVVVGNYIGTDVTGTFAQGNAGDGVFINGASNNVIRDGNVISGNNGRGVTVQGPGANNNEIASNHIGASASGNSDLGNGAFGVALLSASETELGKPGGRNVISGNGFDGVYISGGSDNGVQGNYIGTNVNGTSAISNSRGIGVFDSPSTVIGGLAPGEGNLISGHVTGTGLILSESSSGTIVQGNIIGLNAAGTGPLPNRTGVFLNRPTGVTIGGIAAGSRNVISGNTEVGIDEDFEGVGGSNLIQGNFIGTDISGTLDRGNGTHGIELNQDGNTVAGNLISGNNSAGLFLTGSGSQVHGNLIGTRTDGVSPLGNSSHGIQIASSASNGTLGPDNIIAFNGGDGIFVGSDTGNAISRNSIFANAGLGVDLAPDGVTPNDLGPPPDQDTGANNLQNFPVLTSAGFSATETQVNGTLNSAAGTAFTLEFFASGSCDPGGNGEGATALGSAGITTNGAGNKAFGVVLGATSSGSFITATATDPSGNTSEFSACMQVLDDADDDNDGWTDAQEGPLGTDPRDPCGSDGWPADLEPNNQLNIGDINSFLFPQRLNGTFNKFDHPVPDVDDDSIARWNLEPNATINIGDLNALNPAVTAATSRPPMFGGQPAFFTDVGNGVGGCPFPP